MKQIKTIAIKCDCKDTLNYKDLTEFQGELKARTEEDIAKAKTSILKYGMSFPFFVYKKGTKNYILDGHARKRVFAELEAEGYLIPELPVVYVECKNEKDAKQKLLRLNSQYGKMTKESVLEFAEDIDLNFDEIALPAGVISFDDDGEEKYTKKVASPVYEPTEAEPPKVDELYNAEKAERLQEQIKSAELPEGVKQFLTLASYRFVKFDFTKIAEYYAHIENSEEKELFELLALVIIDYDKAIENGFVEMQSELEKLFKSEGGENA